MDTPKVTRETPPTRPRDLFIGKMRVESVIAATYGELSFRTIIRASHLWNQLCRKRPTNHLERICQECGKKPRPSHGATHYDTMLISALSLLEQEEAILKADWYGFGDETKKDFQALCDDLRRQLC